MSTYMCLVCGYPDMLDPPRDHTICCCCGTQYDYHDSRFSHAELRRRWVAAGMPWHSKRRNPPTNWNPGQQLKAAGFEEPVATTA